MNANYRRVSTRFGPEVRFEVRPRPPALSRAVYEAEFERLKSQLLSERLEELADPALGGDVRFAANEAAALAWVSAYPLLVFPVLFEEKAEAALMRAERQAAVRELSRELLAV